MTPLELEDIARELRAGRPTPKRDFAAELDAWAAEGFPRRAQADRPEPDAAAPPRRPRRGRPRWLLPAFGAAATAVIVMGIAVSQMSTGDQAILDDTRSVSPESPEFEPGGQKADALGQASAPSSTGTIEPFPPPGDGNLRPGKERRQETSASLTLSTEPGDVAEVADGVVGITDRYSGFVVSSNVSTGGEAKARADFDLKIPSQNLQAALTELSELAHVKSRNEGSLDITAPFVSAGERLSDARAEVDALLEELAGADGATEIAAIRAQLRRARAELAAARAQLAELKQRAGFSTVTVAVVSEGDGPGWSLGDAADDAAGVLEWIGGALLVSLAVLIPAGLLGAGLWFGAEALRRRRRESVLDE